MDIKSGALIKFNVSIFISTEKAARCTELLCAQDGVLYSG